MTLVQKVALVEDLFSQLEKESIEFQKLSGIGCVAGCGKCCTYQTMIASPLEFLPWAYHLFLNGEAENTRIQIKETKNPVCFIYKPSTFLGKGSCGDYKYRGLICRLFGFAANTDKHGKLRLATCKIIKEGQSDAYNSTSEAITKGLYVPVFTEYYMQLNQIDFQLGNSIVPINEALIRALEEVLHYYAYRPLPELGQTCG